MFFSLILIAEPMKPDWSLDKSVVKIILSQTYVC